MILAKGETSPEQLTVKSSLEDVKAWHDRLYERALREGLDPPDNDPGAPAFLDEVHELCRTVEHFSGYVTSFDDYRWLSNAALKWQNVYALWDLPMSIDLAAPPRQVAPPALVGNTLTEQELDYWVKTHAELFAYTRIALAHRYSTPDERHHDWRLASVYLASDVCDGKINFFNRIGPASYWRLQAVSLEELKLLRAYLLWLERGGLLQPGEDCRNYFEVCEHLRFMLTHPGIKAPPTEFRQAKTYLLETYLAYGRVDTERRAEAKLLIANKARRLQEATGRPDSLENWLLAEAFVRLFYENIIPAVTDGSREATRAVLKALQCSADQAGSACFLLDVFEVTLATYFLNADLVAELWQAHQGDVTAQPSLITTLPAAGLPRDFVPPAACHGRFAFNEQRVAYKGAMPPAEREALTAALGERYHPIIEGLYRKSRLIRRETTL